MNENKEKNLVRFERQRKNLMITSLLMMIYVWIGFELNKLNVLGNEITINNSGSVEIILWIVFAYFLIRYLQYFLVIEKTELSSMYHVLMDKHIKIRAINAQKKKAISDILKDDPTAKNFLHTVRECSIMERSHHKWLIKVQGSIAYEYASGAARSRGIGSLEWAVLGLHLYYPKLKSLCKVIFFTPYFTEYFLPFLFSAGAIISKIIVGG